MNNNGSDWQQWGQHVLIEIKRLSDQSEKMWNKQEEMNITLAENTNQIAIHIQGVQQAREEIAELRDKTDNRFKPLEKHQIQISTVTKVLGLFAALPAGLYYTLSLAGKVIEMIKK